MLLICVDLQHGASPTLNTPKTNTENTKASCLEEKSTCGNERPAIAGHSGLSPSPSQTWKIVMRSLCGLWTKQ